MHAECSSACGGLTFEFVVSCLVKMIGGFGAESIPESGSVDVNILKSSQTIIL